MKFLPRLLILSALLLAFGGAQADNFRWGDSVADNQVKYDDGYDRLRSNKGRIYLYLGKAEIVNNQLSLENITYVCDATSNSDFSIGNHKSTAAYLNNPLISSEGGQTYSIISVSLSTKGLTSPAAIKAGKPLEAGQYYSVAIKTGTSVTKTDGSGNKYASLVVNSKFVNGDYSMPGSFVKKVEPIADGGYIWGDSKYKDCYVPAYDFSSAKRLNNNTARTYLYLGKAEFKNGVVNFGNLTFVTNSVPGSDGLFGNYSASPTASKLIQDDRIDPKGGQDFTIFIVTPNRQNKMPPTPELTPGYAAHYIGIFTGTSTSAVTSDGARHAQFVIDKATTAKDFYPDKSASDVQVPLIDVSGSTIGVY